MVNDFKTYHRRQVLDIPTNGINTTEDSPTEKLMRVYDNFFYNLINNIQSVQLINDIDNAVDMQLDDIGYDFDIFRNSFSDDFYRILIKLKMMNRNSQGTANELIKLISDTFGFPEEEVQLITDYKINADGTVSGDPMHIRVENIPLENIDHPEVMNLFLDELQNALSAGITLAGATFIVQPSSTLFLNCGAFISKNVIINNGSTD